jgi:hypothetical protein
MQRNREKKATERETDRDRDRDRVENRVERQICEGLNEVSQDQREEKTKCNVYSLPFFFSLSIAGVKSKINSKTSHGVHEGRERERERQRKTPLRCEREREREREQGSFAAREREKR